MVMPTQDSAVLSTGDERSVLEAQLRECFGRVAYSHKTHEKCADIYHARSKRLKITQIGFSAVITGGLLAVLFGKSYEAAVVSAILSTILLAINSYSKDHDLGGLAAKHSEVAADLWGIRESYLSLITDTRCVACSMDDIRHKRDELQNDLKLIYQGSPRTIAKAYKAAQLALKDNEELTFSEDEIDKLLPPDHRKGKE